MECRHSIQLPTLDSLPISYSLGWAGSALDDRGLGLRDELFDLLLLSLEVSLSPHVMR